MLEKTAPVNYAGRGLAYEAEEADRFIYTQQSGSERHSANPKLSTDPDLLPGPALVAAPDPDDDDRARSWRFLEIVGVLDRALPELAEALRYASNPTRCCSTR